MEDQILDINEDAIDYKGKVASKGLRFANALVDSVLIGIPVNYVVNRIVYGEFSLFGPENASLESQMQGLLVNCAIYLIYFTVMEQAFGKTVGKMMTNTRVVNHQGDTPSFGQIIGRSFARYIPFNAFSFLGETGIGWHDSLTKTYVVLDK